VSILSKVDNIFNSKPRETKFKPAQARTKNFGMNSSTYSY